MKRTLIVASFFTASLSLAALPAGAQERRPHANGGGRTAASAPAPRQQAGPQAVPRQAPRAGDSRQYRPQVQPRAGDNRQYQQRAMPRAYGDNRQYQQRAQPGAYGRPGYGTPSYGAQPRYGYAVPRPNGGAHYSQPHYAQPHYAQPYYGRPYYSSPYYYSRPYVRPYAYAPYRPYYFPGSYYSFRPRVSIGFGLWLGYPVAYPYDYLGGYSPRVYGYGPGGYSVGPSVSVYGGVSFDMQPSDADVFVDGNFAGRIGDFTPGSAPLTLTPGVHRIAVQREGFRPMEWEVTIEPGQVIPYRGEMQRF